MNALEKAVAFFRDAKPKVRYAILGAVGLLVLLVLSNCAG